jgi:hypothetical protein
LPEIRRVCGAGKRSKITSEGVVLYGAVPLRSAGWTGTIVSDVQARQYDSWKPGLRPGLRWLGLHVSQAQAQAVRQGFRPSYLGLGLGLAVYFSRL